MYRFARHIKFHFLVRNGYYRDSDIKHENLLDDHKSEEITILPEAPLMEMYKSM